MAHPCPSPAMRRRLTQCGRARLTVRPPAPRPRPSVRLAGKLVDDWGMAIVPANLTLGRGKWARNARDIYLRITGGINGTPMPESGDALTPDQVWQVVHYVQALGAWTGSTAQLRKVAAELPPTSATLP